jgi:hypothetical protein
MSAQLPFLFNPPPERLAYQGATPTAVQCSREAAIGARVFSGTQEARALAWWRSQGAYGGTDPECSEATGIARASLCLRRRSLLLRGDLEDSGRTRRHQVGGGRATRCTVYVATRGVQPQETDR